MAKSHEEKGHWMEHVHPKKGALHKEMGIPEGEKIPAAKLEKAAHVGGLLGKRARLAEEYRKAKH